MATQTLDTWRKKLQKASFRGVPFSVQTTETQEGRRGVLHEYPLRDVPYVEDMGRAAGKFSIEAIILGPDYFVARDALRDALRQAGPGELIHPTLGRMTVALTDPYNLSESLTDEGGLAKFRLSFCETAEVPLPAVSSDTTAQVETAADTARAAAIAEFENDFDIAHLPGFAQDAVLKTLDDAVEALEGVTNGFLPDLSGAQALIEQTSQLSRALTTLIGGSGGFASSIFGLASAAAAALQRPVDAIHALETLFRWRSEETYRPAGTPSRKRAQENAATVVTLIQRAAVTEAARAVAEIDFSIVASRDETRLTYQDAVDLRGKLADALDEAGATAGHAVYAALMDLRTALVRDIGARADVLPRASHITMPSTLPALVVAYRAYGDASRDAELLALNPTIRHPGFVPGGRPLVVLSA
jgi:prophage DNA circulation protein